MKSLVCLHGFTGGAGAWGAVLATLPGDVEALCPPIVGHDPGIPLSGASFEDEVDRLASLLPPSKGPLHLAGYSLGGRLALGLLARHRERFTSATLIGTHPGLGEENQRRRRAAGDDALARRLEREGVERFADHWQSLPLLDTQHALPARILEDQRRRRLRHRPEGLAYALETLSLGRMPDYRTELPRLDLPVHLMAGERDEKFRRLAEQMASALPAATVEIVPDAGHNLILETPGAVASAILPRLSQPGGCPG